MHSGCIVIVNRPPGAWHPRVAELLGPDLEDLRRRRQAVTPGLGRWLELRPVIEAPRDRHLDERPLRPEPRALGNRVAVALADAVQAVVVGHQRRVVGEPGRGDQLERRRAERPVRRPPAARPRTTDPLHGGDAPVEDLALLVPRHGGEVLVEPAVAGELVAAGEDRLGRGRERLERVPRHEPGGRDAAVREQREDPRRADPHAELRVRQLDRRIAAADAVGDRVVVEGQGDGEAGQIGHRPIVVSPATASR